MKGKIPITKTVIAYSPFKDEVDPNKLCPPLSTPSFLIPFDKNIDPFLFATLMSEKLQNYGSVSIIIPGQQFDRFGTRHGRGGGWYDKFLSKAPSHWVKIGFCNKKQFSTKKLSRAEWDIPMDYIATVDNDNVIRFEYEKFY